VTAAVNTSASYEDAADRSYPERIAVRITEPSRHLYEALEDAFVEDGVAVTHRILALVDLCWHQASPEQRKEIVEHARQIRRLTMDAANGARARAIRGRTRRRRLAVAEGERMAG
jgi:hypothetical protein